VHSPHAHGVSYRTSSAQEHVVTQRVRKDARVSASQTGIRRTSRTCALMRRQTGASGREGCVPRGKARPGHDRAPGPRARPTDARAESRAVPARGQCASGASLPRSGRVTTPSVSSSDVAYCVRPALVIRITQRSEFGDGDYSRVLLAASCRSRAGRGGGDSRRPRPQRRRPTARTSATRNPASTNDPRPANTSPTQVRLIQTISREPTARPAGWAAA
jgi:hypothetical protein